MTHVRFMLAGAALAVAAAPLGAQDTMTQAERHWGAVARCAQGTSAAERHACMDNVLREAGLLSGAQQEAETRETFGETARLKDRQRQDAAVQGVAPPPVEELEELATTVTNSLFASDRNVVLFTPEGTVWKQRDGSKLRFLPDKGDDLTIMRAAMGSYRCKLGRGTIFRCERLQ